MFRVLFNYIFWDCCRRRHDAEKVNRSFFHALSVRARKCGHASMQQAGKLSTAIVGIHVSPDPRIDAAATPFVGKQRIG